MRRAVLIGLLSLAVCLLGPQAAVSSVSTSASWFAESNQALAQFGGCVSTAGDVNGDGYSDIIVGARFLSNGQSSEGKTYLFLGGPNGVAAAPAWTAESDQANAEFGNAVGTAGDVNNDGFDDILVGAWSYSNGQSQEGRVYLYLGSPTGPPRTPSWTWEPNLAGARAGASVATAGDVNGDGYDDVIVGAVGYTNNVNQPYKGAAYAFLGGPGGLAPTPAWTVLGTQTMEFLGSGVSTAGDVNGDGYADVLVGAPGYMNTFASEGRVFAYYGSPGGLPGAASWTKDGGQNNARLGTSVSTAGDTNGDGYSDIIAGAPLYDNGQLDEGAALVFMGSPTGLTASIAMAMEGNQEDANLGTSVFTAGDVNGDGYADVIIGTPGFSNGQSAEGRAQVHLGGPTGLFPGPAWSSESNQEGAWHGESVGTAGDVNGDGFGDVIAGAPFFDNGQEDEGRACVYDGSGDGLSTTAAWQIEGNMVSAALGFRVAPAGDVNGDGYSDLVVSEYKYASPESNEGRVVVFHGGPAGPPTTPSWAVESNRVDAFLGYSVASAGDVNGDGYGDLIAGAPGYGNNLGIAYVYLGSPAGLSATPAWTATGSAAGDYFGHSVASAGDVNGDGYADVIIGADLYSHGESGEGAAYIYLGSGSGLSATSAWSVEGNQANARLGRCVASAGDVNGDGYSDVIVGAPAYYSPAVDPGRALVYLGSPGEMSTAPAWTRTGEQVGNQFGFSVSSAGDVNGDGYDEVIVGANAYDSQRGRVYVYHGSSAGLLTTPALVLSGDQVGGELGVSVAGAGDVNNDGYSDVVIGASLYTNGELQEGRAYVHHGSPSGLLTTPAWIGEPNRAQATYGLSVAGAGDVNGDGFDDVCVGAPTYYNGQWDEGMAYVYYGGTGLYFAGPGGGVQIVPRQRRINGGGPIEWLSLSDDCCSFRLRALERTAYGRNQVRLEWNVAVLSTALGTVPLQRGTVRDTGAPVPGQGSFAQGMEVLSGLTMTNPYHWRLRTAGGSPYFPRSPWFGVPRSVPSEKHLRVGSSACDVQVMSVANRGLRLEAARPNPLRDQTTLRYELTHSEHVLLTIHDAAGRRVTTLVDALESAGSYAANWNGCEARGSRSPNGVYYVRLNAGNDVRTTKLILMR
jgi:hypothetical protein